MGKFFGYALGVLIFLGKILRKKVYILCVHIEGRVVGSRKRGSSKKGSKNISTSKGVLIKEGDKRGMNRGSTNRRDK